MLGRKINTLKEVKETLGLRKWKKLTTNDWKYISKRLPLTETFIGKYRNKLDWDCISEYQHLSEEFIDKHSIYANWWNISISQHLSESFIDKHKDEIYWSLVSKYQRLSESFIEKHKNEVDWYSISVYQHLSEAFIERYADKISWSGISIFQQLSEAFIERYTDEVNWDCISRYQHLSEPFLKKHNLPLPENNYMAWTTEEKRNAVIQTGLYECYEDYFIAYKGIRKDRYSAFNFQYQYLPGETYKTHADYSNNKHSFGFSAWTEKEARKYCDELVVKVKIYYEDVARVVHDGGKIRCCKMTVLD